MHFMEIMKWTGNGAKSRCSRAASSKTAGRGQSNPLCVASLCFRCPDWNGISVRFRLEYAGCACFDWKPPIMSGGRWGEIALSTADFFHIFTVKRQEFSFFCKKLF